MSGVRGLAESGDCTSAAGRALVTICGIELVRRVSCGAAILGVGGGLGGCGGVGGSSSASSPKTGLCFARTSAPRELTKSSGDVTCADRRGAKKGAL